ncbi:MAG: hypothetical protein GY820_13415 [Gammaproteobacteria bacterium]|nr:hypothetical protein [Gammaproteobacteria bacterium]
MPKGHISVTQTGLSEYIKDLDDLADNLQAFAKQSLQSQLEVAEDKIRTNWVSMVGGSSSGYVYNSIGHNTEYSTQDDAGVVGKVGVFHVDAIAAKFRLDYVRGSKKGKKRRAKSQLTAAQISYWVEYGTSRLRSGARKNPTKEYKDNDEDLITVTPQPFISNAVYASLDEQQAAFKVTFDKLINGMGL